MFYAVQTVFTLVFSEVLSLLLTRPQVLIKIEELIDHLGPVFKTVEDLAPKGAHSKGLC